MTTMRLADVVVAATGSRNPAKQSDEEFTYVDVAAIDNETKSITGEKRMNGAEAPSRARKLLRAGDVLVSTVRPNLNAVALVPEALDGQIASTGFCVLRAKTEVVLPEYLFYFVRSKQFVEELTKLVSGALYPAVTDRQVLDQRIPVTSLAEQRRIVDLLSHAEGILRLRREAQAKAQAIIPALFLDMFGDPATNLKRWPMQPLGQVLSAIDSGHSPKCHSRKREDGEWAVLRLGAITQCEYDESEHKTLPDHLEPDLSVEVVEGDLLLSRKNTPELVGASAYVWATGGRILLPDLIFRLRIADPTRVDSIYLWKLLTSKPKRQALTSLATGSAGSMPNISKERLRTLSIELPPRALQARFSEHVRQLQSITAQQTESFRKAGTIFQTLLVRTFS